jgi:hypothetical protein
MTFAVRAPTRKQSTQVDTRNWYPIIMSIFRISRPDDDQVVDVDSLDAAEGTIAFGKPGRRHVDEIGSEPLPSVHTSRRWGIGIKRDDGTVVIEPDPAIP